MRLLRIVGLLVALFAFAGAGDALAQGKPKVKFITSLGEFIVELEPEKAPGTVENFLGYVRDGHYTGTIFHRVIPGFVVQGGGFSREYRRRRTGAPIRNEADTGLSNERGTIAMARTSDPHSATDQFYINIRLNKGLDHTAKTRNGWGYTAFGRVIDGMRIISRISRVERGPGGPFRQDVPRTPVVIEKAEIIN